MNEILWFEKKYKSFYVSLNKQALTLGEGAYEAMGKPAAIKVGLKNGELILISHYDENSFPITPHGNGVRIASKDLIRFIEANSNIVIGKIAKRLKLKLKNNTLEARDE